MIDIKEETTGRWPGIFSALGIEVGQSGCHTACPICQPGESGCDRFRMDDKDGSGSWICNNCGAGDGFSLVMKVLSIDFKEAVKAIRDVIGACDMTKTQPEPKISKELLRKIYIGSKPVYAGDPVFCYLKNRGLKLTSDKLRYHPVCYEPETHYKMPAMLATFALPDGTAITMHRTFLTQNGDKASIKNPKKVLPALQSMVGGAIRLYEPIDGVIGIAEGIETAMACYELKGIPTWSAVSNTILEGFEPPKGIKCVFIFGDKDLSYTGQKSAYILANRLTVQNKIDVEVCFPDENGDFLDQLNRESGPAIQNDVEI